MRPLLRKFAAQLILACLLLGTLIPADALAQAAPARDRALAATKQYLEERKVPPKEIEQKLENAGKIWDVAQKKGIDDIATEGLMKNLAGRNYIHALDQHFSALEKVLDRSQTEVLNNSSLNPNDKGLILASLARAEAGGISEDRQKVMFDTLMKMEPRLNEARSQQGDAVTYAMLETASDALQSGIHPEKAIGWAETISKLGENLKMEGRSEAAITTGLSFATSAMLSGLEDEDKLQKITDKASELRDANIPHADINAAGATIRSSINSGMSEEKQNEAIENAIRSSKTSREETGSTAASRIAGITTGESSLKGNETSKALVDGKAASDIIAEIEEEKGALGANNAMDTTQFGVLNNNKNTREAAHAVAEITKEATEEGASLAEVNAMGNATGGAMLRDVPREEAEKIGEKVRATVKEGQDRGEGGISLDARAQNVLDLELKARGAPEAKTEEKEETPAQPAQPEEKEETPAQPAQPEEKEETPAQPTQQ